MGVSRKLAGLRDRASAVGGGGGDAQTSGWEGGWADDTLHPHGASWETSAAEFSFGRAQRQAPSTALSDVASRPFGTLAVPVDISDATWTTASPVLDAVTAGGNDDHLKTWPTVAFAPWQQLTLWPLGGSSSTRAPKSCPRGVFPSHFFTPGWFFKDLGAMFFVCSIMDSLSLSTCDTCRLRVQVARSSRTVDRDRTGLTESSVPLRCPPRPPHRPLPVCSLWEPLFNQPRIFHKTDIASALWGSRALCPQNSLAAPSALT